jgi:hypothetical protein
VAFSSAVLVGEEDEEEEEDEGATTGEIAKMERSKRRQNKGRKRPV